MASNHTTGDVLVVEGDGKVGGLAARLSTDPSHSWRIDRAETLSEALRLVSTRPFDAILVSTDLPDASRPDAIARVCSQAPGSAVVAVSTLPDVLSGVEAIQHGAQDYLSSTALGPGELGAKLVVAIERQKALLATAQLAAIVDHSDDAIVSVTLDATILSWNDGAERMYGYTAAEARGRSLAMLVPEDRAGDLDRIREHLRRGIAIRAWDTVRRAKNGRRVDVSLTVSPIHVVHASGPRMPGGAIVARDVSGKKAAERALAESESQYRILFEDNPHPMWIYEGGSLRFLAVNDAAVRQYGYTRDEFLRMTLRDIRPADELEALEAQVAERRREPRRQRFKLARTWIHRRKDGELIDVEITASPIRFLEHPDAWLALAADVTERKRLEALYFHAQKLESVGRLAGAVAHDFNNLLGVVTGYGEIMARQLPPDSPLAPRVAEILKAASRAADLTRQLLAFSRKQVMEPRVLSLEAIVADHEPMFRRLLGPNIELVTGYGEALGRVRADPGQISQVLVNLVVNARDAMPAGGRLIIETQNVDLDDDYAALRPDVTAGRYVSLTVSDTGLGMSAETLGKIFEPFFTTKEEGRGTGLGLSTVYGIVKQSGGHIWTYSEPGKGTTFRIYLPRVDVPAEDAPAPPRAAATDGGNETILVVEDNEPLRSIIAEVLTEAGYSVLAAANGEEAVKAVEGLAKPVDLVISDVVMPVMGGDTLARRLQAVRFLFMSGYSALSVEHHFGTDVAFLQKPFPPGALLRKVRQVLDAK